MTSDRVYPELRSDDLPMTAGETVMVAAGGCLAMWTLIATAGAVAYGVVAVVRWLSRLIF